MLKAISTRLARVTTLYQYKFKGKILNKGLVSKLIGPVSTSNGNSFINTTDIYVLLNI